VVEEEKEEKKNRRGKSWGSLKYWGLKLESCCGIAVAISKKT